MGGSVLVNLLITYLKQTHGLDEKTANGVYTIALILVVLGNLISIVPSARISDRTGRKPVIYVACAIGFAGGHAGGRGARSPDRHPRCGALRRLRRNVPCRRLGADDRHHPARFVWPDTWASRTSPRRRRRSSR
jgi:hypothetical protein